jgi:hypothetical protein
MGHLQTFSKGSFASPHDGYEIPLLPLTRTLKYPSAAVQCFVDRMIGKKL